MLDKARKLLRKGLVVKARKLLERARSLPPEGRLLLAEGCYRLRLNSQAARHAAKALPDARAHLVLGGLALDNGQHDRAEERFHAAYKSLRSKKLKARALSALSVCMAMQRLLTTAGRFVRQAMALAPEDAIVLRDVSFVKDEQGKRREALKFARRAGRNLAGHMARARILAEEGHLDEALAELEGAEERGPEEVDVFLALAEVYEAKGKFLAAADALRRSVEISPRGDHARSARPAEVRLRLLGEDRAGAAKTLGRTRGRERDRLARALSSRKGRVIIRGFPVVRQRWDFCGPAALEMLLKHCGLPDGQMVIAADVWDGGTPLYMMKSYARGRGLFAVSFHGDARKLKGLLDRGIPCVIDVTREGEQHYLIALGYDPSLREFIFRDPSEIALLWMTERGLREVWEPEGNWALVAVPRGMRASVTEAGVEADDGIDLAERACRLFDRGRFGQSLSQARRALQRGGGGPAARVLCASLAAGGRWKEAGKEAARLREQFPRLDWTFAAEGEALWAVGRLEEAEKLLRKARAPAGRLSHAAILLEMRKPGRAEREIDKALAVEPDSAAAHAFLGRVHVLRGEHEKALAEYGKATELDPDDAHIRAELGYAFEKAGEISKAERALRRALKLEARDPWILNQLAYFLAEHDRRLDEAVLLARKAVKIERGNRSYVCDTLGWTLLKRGKLREGLEWLRLAERTDDGRDPEGLAEVLYHVALGLKKAGKERQAAAKLRKAAGLKGEYARRARKDLP